MIVGIGFNFQVGKDTAADALTRDLNYRKIAFADPLRAFAMEIDPIVTSATQSVNIGIGRGRLAWAIQGLGYERAKEMYPEVRQLLQRIGLGARKMFGENFWVDQAIRGVKSGDRVVFSDVRFRNEAQAVRLLGGRLIRIVRPGYEGDGHPSEQGWGDIEPDVVIVNDAGIVDLERKVVDYVRSELPKRENQQVLP